MKQKFKDKTMYLKSGNISCLNVFLLSFGKEILMVPKQEEHVTRTDKIFQIDGDILIFVALASVPRPIPSSLLRDSMSLVTITTICPPWVVGSRALILIQFCEVGNIRESLTDVRSNSSLPLVT